MIKINRPNTPEIKIYTLKKDVLKNDLRLNVLKLIDANSVGFKDFIPRLSDPAEKYTKAGKETLMAINYYADPNNFKTISKKPLKRHLILACIRTKN
jgi:hypothetical protein